MSAADIKQAMWEGAKQVEFRVGSVSFQLVRIEPGQFEMGSPPSEEGHKPNEGPVRSIQISKPFYLGRYEITQAQYKAVAGVNPSNFQGDSLAVDQISYPDALEFCKKISQSVGMNITLPTEAQWEYACRAGTKTRFYSGNTLTDLEKVAWYAGNSADMIHPVGQKQPNAWGLYDMHGNVWELCLDFLEQYNKIESMDPRGVMNSNRGAMRGGGWMDEPEYCRSACRLVSDVMFGGSGIRIAINP